MKTHVVAQHSIARNTDAAGATAEVCATFYKACITQGLDVGQALDLTKTFLAGIVMRPADRNDD